MMAVSDPWLDKSFYEVILQSEHESRGTGETVSVLNCNVESGVDPGCNFMSTILRVKVEYSTKKCEKSVVRSFIVKVPLSNSLIHEKQLFENEIKMYDEIIPKINEIAHLQIAPKRYICSLPDCLVMEDLKPAGYVMCSTIKKLDFKQAKASLVNLAKLHAASVAVKKDYPELIKQNGEETVFSHEPKYSNRFKPRILMRLYGLARVLQTIDSCEKYGNILLDAGETFWDLIVEVLKPMSKLNVLNHGDFWTNNLLFKYDNAGFINDVKFIDFQMRRYCSPAFDLLYFFWTSADDGVRMRMYELIEMYRHTLNSSLAELGCPERLSGYEMKEEVSKSSPIILLICLFLPVIFPDPISPFNISEIKTSDESIMTSMDFNVNPILIPFKGKYFRQFLPEMCKELETMKIFQILVKNKK